MFIYVDEYYNNLKLNRKKLDKDIIKDTVLYLINKYNYKIKLPVKVIYSIIYFIKHNCKINIIHKIIVKLISKICHRFSLFKFNTIQKKWYVILKLCIINNQDTSILNYFFELYNIYLKKETKNNTVKLDKLYIIQAKQLLGINIRNIRQLKKYLKLNLNDTIFYIDIIFSKISIKYLSFNYIFDIEN